MQPLVVQQHLHEVEANPSPLYVQTNGLLEHVDFLHSNKQENNVALLNLPASIDHHTLEENIKKRRGTILSNITHQPKFKYALNNILNMLMGKNENYLHSLIWLKCKLDSWISLDLNATSMSKESYKNIKYPHIRFLFLWEMKNELNFKIVRSISSDMCKEVRIFTQVLRELNLELVPLFHKERKHLISRSWIYSMYSLSFH